jgi:uncharacterized protein (UPF0264 family)
MRVRITTRDPKPRVVAEFCCDVDLLVSCVKDGEIIPAQVAKQLNEFASTVSKALHEGVAKRKREAEES